MPSKLHIRSALGDVARLASSAICPACEYETTLRILRRPRARQYQTHSFPQTSSSSRRPRFLQFRPRLQALVACRQRQHPSLPRHDARLASTLRSSTAINAKKEIPPDLQDLHRALERLKRDAASYVNLSRLQLALRGLESERPVIRLAVLGLHGQKTARLLARLLVADALSDEGAWERKLYEAGGDGEGRRGLLLSYGDETDHTHTNPLVTTMHIPSRVLKNYNLEILISTIALPTSPTLKVDNAEALKSTALVPTTEAPRSFSGSVSSITYPVHRALVVADGIPGLLTLGRYILPSPPSPSHQTQKNSAVKLAIQLPALAGATHEDPTTADIAIVDGNVASQALNAFRKSTSNAKIYEEGWFDSGMPALKAWFSQLSPSENSTKLNPAVMELIHDLLSETSKNILLEESARTMRASTLEFTTLDASKQSLNDGLTAWSTAAHMELRDKLDKVFASKKWAKLKWWKLWWRVDDVTMISSELFERGWLVEAEKGIIWLVGRGAEQGFLYDDALEEAGADEAIAMATREETKKLTRDPPVIATSMPLNASPPTTTTTPRPPTSTPQHPLYPTLIPRTRYTLLTTLPPTLQSLAQRLLLQTITISTLSTALSTLLYISFPSITLFSAGAVAAFGTVFSLRRMQTRWENGRETWEGEVRERGRVVLREIEVGFRGVLEGGVRKGSVGKESERERRGAKQSVAGARGVLDIVMGGK